MRIKHILGATLSVVVLSGFATPMPAQADAMSDFYKKKIVKIIVGASSGGGYGTYARSVSRHISKYIPGKPKLINQFMQGAASIRAANFVYNVAPQDGTIIGAVQRAIPFLPLYGKRGPKYDAQKFQYIGSINNEVSICVAWHTTGVKTIQDVMKKELIIGGAGANDTENFPSALNNILGTKFKIITGYTGVGINLAMERQEVYGRCGWSWTSFKNQKGEWLKDKKVNILIQLSLKRLPEIGNVPLVTELAKTKEDRQTFELVFAPQVMGRPFLMGPGVSAEKVAMMRAAFLKVTADPALLKELGKQQMDVAPVTGKEIQDIIASAYKTPKSIVDRARQSMVYKGKRVKVKIKMLKDTGMITKIIRGGRKLEMKLANGKTVKTSVSGRRTKVTIGGKKTKRKNIKIGMTCTFNYPGSGQRSKAIDCK
jgi:tripartite-type tricarboxylate transporter receptor subunit TctC